MNLLIPIMGKKKRGGEVIPTRLATLMWKLKGTTIASSVLLNFGESHIAWLKYIYIYI